MKDSTKDTFLYEEDRPPIASKPDSVGEFLLSSLRSNPFRALQRVQL